MKPPSTPSESVLVAEYLADREGLQGMSRGRFLQLLEGSLGYGSRARQGDAWAFGGVAFGVAALGMAAETWRRGGWEMTTLLAWLACAVLGLALAVALARAERRRERTDWEVEWRVYCLLLRPFILAEKPGLLDRNLASDHGAEERLDLHPRRAVAAILRERRTDLWCSGVVGWCLGMTALMFWRVAMGPMAWAFALPPAGFIVAPMVWGFWRVAAYRRVERAARELR